MTTVADVSAAGRIALGIEYDGTDFCGWQVQPTGRTVQNTLERALAKVADAPVSTVCAGRTDTGVHALGQVVHFDAPVRRAAAAWQLGGNANLPADVRIVWAREVGAHFHARFGALARRYRYVILNRPHASALYRQRACWERRDLDVTAMASAARSLVGEHDFTAFRAAGCQAANPVRIVHSLEVQRHGPWVVIDIVANAFLQNMVRIVAGVLLRVGCGDAAPGWVAQILADRQRGHRGKTATACALYFVSVNYPAEFGLDDASTVVLTPDGASL